MTMAKLRVSTDSGQTWVEVNDVRIEVTREEDFPLLITANEQGVVIDVQKDTETCEELASEWMEWVDLTNLALAAEEKD